MLPKHQAIETIGHVDGAVEWKRTYWGFLFRWWFIGSATVAEIGLSGAISAWKSLPWYWFCCLSGYGVLVFVFLWAMRRVVICRTDSDRFIHDLCHETRDDVAIIRFDTFDIGVYKTRLHNFHNETAERIATYFRTLLRDDSIKCIIRVVENPEDGAAQYATRGRSKGMATERNQNSEPILATEGLPRFFLEKRNGIGVVICRDIPDLTAKGIWKGCKTDEIGDVKTAMVAPINSYDCTEFGITKTNGKPQKAMLGLLCVVSARDPFTAVHANPLKAFADLLGFAFQVIYDSKFNETTRVQGKPHVAFSRQQAGQKSKKEKA